MWVSVVLFVSSWLVVTWSAVVSFSTVPSVPLVVAGAVVSSAVLFLVLLVVVIVLLLLEPVAVA